MEPLKFCLNQDGEIQIAVAPQVAFQQHDTRVYYDLLHTKPVNRFPIEYYNRQSAKCHSWGARKQERFALLDMKFLSLS